MASLPLPATMQFNACATAIGTHGWVFLCHGNVDGAYIAECALYAADNASCDVFEKVRRLRHLTLHKGEQLGVVERVGHVIGPCGSCERISNPQINCEISTDPPFLRAYTMIGIEAQAVERNIAVFYHEVMRLCEDKSVLAPVVGATALLPLH